MRTVLVTGAGRNIGYAVAEHFVAQGCRVGLNGLDEERLERAAEQLSARGEVLAVPGDVADPAAVAGVLERLASWAGPVEILVNNAGIRAHGPLDELALDHWHRVLDVVLTGAFLTSRAVLPGMRSNGWGRIVNVAGMSGQTGAAGRAPVVAAKAGLIGLTKATAHDAGHQQITVNAVSPGLIDTERRPGLGDDEVARSHYAALGEHRSPAGRPGTPAEVAGLVGYLCSDTAAYVTGQVIGINGGAHM